MSTVLNSPSARERKNQIATREAVWAACDALFLSGEKITEATVRARLGGGSTTTILKLIRDWDDRLRTEFIRLQATVAQYEEGDIPPDVPEALWAAVKPVWGQVLEAAQVHAEGRLADARAALAAEKAALETQVTQVRDLDARWQQEKQDWTVRIDGLNTEIARLKGRATELAQDLIQAGHEASARTVEIDALQQQLASAEERIHTAEAAHQADLERWAQQVDEARQEAKAKDASASARIRALESQLASIQATVSDLRIEHERVKGEAVAAQSADTRSMAELARLREELASIAAARHSDAQEHARIVSGLQGELETVRGALAVQEALARQAGAATKDAGRGRRKEGKS